jgi:uncharacterized protein YcbX
MPARLHRITIYPIKSLDGVAVDEVEVLPSGCLANDRRFALFDADGRFVNGKRTAAIHYIRAAYDLANLRVQLRDTARDHDTEFSLADSQIEIGAWLSEAIGIPCLLKESATSGFPDDTDAPGPTLISTATLREITRWFPGLTLDETRRRFRANLEIDGVDPFWEDQLVGPTGTQVPFRIGNIDWLGINPCQRCVVPTRASDTGQTMPLFQKTFAANRQSTLPPWAPADRFNHFYRLAVNTRLARHVPPAILQVGDVLSPVSSRPAQSTQPT